MIKTVHGDVLAVERGIILHGCNAQGVMGSGIARQVKEQFPTAYTKYKMVEREEGLKLGTIIVDSIIPKQKYILNCITQNLYGEYQRQVDYEAVAKCMEELVDRLRVTEFTLPICFPQIGFTEIHLRKMEYQCLVKFVKEINTQKTSSKPGKNKESIKK